MNPKVPRPSDPTSRPGADIKSPPQTTHINPPPPPPLAAPAPVPMPPAAAASDPAAAQLKAKARRGSGAFFRIGRLIGCAPCSSSSGGPAGPSACAMAGGVGGAMAGWPAPSLCGVVGGRRECWVGVATTACGVCVRPAFGQIENDREGSPSQPNRRLPSHGRSGEALKFHSAGTQGRVVLGWGIEITLGSTICTTNGCLASSGFRQAHVWVSASLAIRSKRGRAPAVGRLGGGAYMPIGVASRLDSGGRRSGVKAEAARVLRKRSRRSPIMSGP